MGEGFGGYSLEEKDWFRIEDQMSFVNILILNPTQFERLRTDYIIEVDLEADSPITKSQTIQVFLNSSVTFDANISEFWLLDAD